jgi:hypothetical protein
VNRRLDYAQIALIGGMASHLSIRSRSDMIAALILGAGPAGENHRKAS